MVVAAGLTRRPETPAAAARLAALAAPLCLLLAGCGGQAETGSKAGSSGEAARVRDADFGDSCSSASKLDVGLCCCNASGLVAYGDKLTSSALCKDGLACTGSDAGFCSRRPHNGTAPYAQQATLSFCQFTCPCCEDVALLASSRGKQRLGHAGRAETASAGLAVGGAGEMSGPTRGALLSQQWRGEAVMLFDVVNSTFHRNLMQKVNATYTLEEFYKARMEYPTWAAMRALRDGRNWTDPELAMYMYTTEAPLIYRPMNKMMREAHKMEDIDKYWQSYIAILRDGLTGHAPFVSVNTYRGVDCDAGDVLHVGEEGVLPSFTSTSTELAVAEAFGCTILHFAGGGYDLRQYSHFPGEAEVLLEQGRVYNVTRSVADSHSGAVHVHLKTEFRAGGGSVVSVSKHAPRRTCQGLDPSQCDICRCCDKPPSSEISLAQRPRAASGGGPAELARRKKGLHRDQGVMMMQVQVAAAGVELPSHATEDA